MPGVITSLLDIPLVKMVNCAVRRPAGTRMGEIRGTSDEVDKRSLNSKRRHP